MKLETEFRIRQQLLQLARSLHACPVSHLPEACCEPVLTQSARPIWVRLLCTGQDFGHDEALLLCQCSANRWLAWVPEHGEIVLAEDEFCVP